MHLAISYRTRITASSPAETKQWPSVLPSYYLAVPVQVFSAMTHWTTIDGIQGHVICLFYIVTSLCFQQLITHKSYDDMLRWYGDMMIWISSAPHYKSVASTRTHTHSLPIIKFIGLILLWGTIAIHCKGHNPLQTKHRPLYLKTQSVPRCKHFSSRLQKPISLYCKWHKSLFVLR